MSRREVQIRKIATVALAWSMAGCGCNSGGIEFSPRSPEKSVSAVNPQPEDAGDTKSNLSRTARFTSALPIDDGDDVPEERSILLPNAVAAMFRRTIHEPPVDFDLEFLEKSAPIGIIECDGNEYELHFELLVSVSEPRRVWTNHRVARLSHQISPESTRADILKMFADFAREDVDSQPQGSSRKVIKDNSVDDGIQPVE